MLLFPFSASVILAAVVVVADACVHFERAGV